MKQLFIQVTYVNETSGYTEHVEDITETDHTNLKSLYATLRRNCGGRITKMYIDTKTGPKHIGYIVTSKQRYTDTNEQYVQSAWYELLEPVQVLETVTKYKAVGT